MAKLIGTDPNQVPTNADLGDMAYQNGRNMAKIKAQEVEVDSGAAQSNLYLRTSDDTHYDWRWTNEGNVNRLRLTGSKTGLSTVFPLYVNGDAGGAITMPEQPAFSVTRNSTAGNLAVNTLHTLSWGTEIFDQNNNFSNTTFTAPVTGKYHLSTLMRWQQVDSAAAYIDLRFVTTNRSYQWIFAPDDDLAQDADFMNASASVLADMDAGDTAYMTIYISGGASQMDIEQGSHFFGFLVA